MAMAMAMVPTPSPRPMPRPTRSVLEWVCVCGDVTAKLDVAPVNVEADVDDTEVVFTASWCRTADEGDMLARLGSSQAIGIPEAISTMVPL